MSALNPLRWLVYVFNSVVNTKLPVILSHRCSNTVSLETYPLSKFFILQLITFAKPLHLIMDSSGDILLKES